jgi:hypothetical protein
LIEFPLTDVRSLDHRDIIATVAYTAHSLLGELPNQSCHIGLLGGGATTGDHSWKLRGKNDEFGAKAIQA